MSSSALKAMQAKAIREPDATPEETRPDSGKARRRVNDKVHVGAWLSPAYKQSLLLIRAANPDLELQDLVAEALNDLFEKYRVPSVRG